jgi:hypothetical protein
MLLSDVLYLIIIKVLFQWMACTYHQDGIGIDYLINANVDPSSVPAYFTSGAHVTLDANPLESCWTSYHSMYALMSMVLLPLYTFTSNTVGIYFLEDMQGTEIKFSQSYTMTLRFFKTVIVSAVVLFSVDTVVSSAMVFVCLVCVGVSTYRLEDSCSIPALRRFRIFTSVVCSWVALVSLIGELMDDDTSALSFILLVGGLAVISVGLLVYRQCWISEASRRLFHHNARFKPKCCIRKRKTEGAEIVEGEAEKGGKKGERKGSVSVVTGTASFAHQSSSTRTYKSRSQSSQLTFVRRGEGSKHGKISVKKAW